MAPRYAYLENSFPNPRIQLPLILPPMLTVSNVRSISYNHHPIVHHQQLRISQKGPFKVISRTPKHFKVDLGNRTDSISIDRLKCAHLDTELVLPASTTPDAPKSTSTPEEPEARRTRSGRRVHFPDRYGLVVYR